MNGFTLEDMALFLENLVSRKNGYKKLTATEHAHTVACLRNLEQLRALPMVIRKMPLRDLLNEDAEQEEAGVAITVMLQALNNPPLGVPGKGAFAASAQV
jgi:hypothetical protein